MARTLVSRHGFAVRLACRTVGISTSSYYYQSKGKAEDEQIADCLIKLTQTNKRWGGVSQASCPISYAANTTFLSNSLLSFDGFSQTSLTGFQLRTERFFQRSGLASLAVS